MLNVQSQQYVHPAAIWQMIQTYPLPYHWHTEYRAASFYRLWESSTHSQHLTKKSIYWVAFRDKDLHFVVLWWGKYKIRVYFILP